MSGKFDYYLDPQGEPKSLTYLQALQLPSNFLDDFDEAVLKQQATKLMLQFHPDKNKDHEESAKKVFQIVYGAYEYLKDPNNRFTFDGSKVQEVVITKDFDFKVWAEKMAENLVTLQGIEVRLNAYIEAKQNGQENDLMADSLEQILKDFAEVYKGTIIDKAIWAKQNALISELGKHPSSAADKYLFANILLAVHPADRMGYNDMDFMGAAANEGHLLALASVMDRALAGHYTNMQESIEWAFNCLRYLEEVVFVDTENSRYAAGDIETVKERVQGLRQRRQGAIPAVIPSDEAQFNKIVRDYLAYREARGGMSEYEFNVTYSDFGKEEPALEILASSEESTDLLDLDDENALFEDGSWTETNPWDESESATPSWSGSESESESEFNSDFASDSIELYTTDVALVVLKTLQERLETILEDMDDPAQPNLEEIIRSFSNLHEAGCGLFSEAVIPKRNEVNALLVKTLREPNEFLAYISLIDKLFNIQEIECANEYFNALEQTHNPLGLILICGRAFAGHYVEMKASLEWAFKCLKYLEEVVVVEAEEKGDDSVIIAKLKATIKTIRNARGENIPNVIPSDEADFQTVVDNYVSYRASRVGDTASHFTLTDLEFFDDAIKEFSLERKLEQLKSEIEQNTAWHVGYGGTAITNSEGVELVVPRHVAMIHNILTNNDLGMTAEGKRQSISRVLAYTQEPDSLLMTILKKLDFLHLFTRHEDTQTFYNDKYSFFSSDTTVEQSTQEDIVELGFT